jgi:hypothetical protein
MDFSRNGLKFIAWIDLAQDKKMAGSCVYNIEPSGYIKCG